MSKSIVVEVRTRGGALELAERPIPDPAEDQVRIRIEACGICRGDDVCRLGFWPGITYPRIPGHEVIGVVDAIGSGVAGWEEGERVGTGWTAGYCEDCYECRRGDFAGCKNSNINGIFNDGGYAQFMTVSEHALVRIPRDCYWSSEEIAPLLCAGVSTFAPLRASGIRAGELVAVQGIGGLGHLAIQFAHRMGYKVAAISSGPDKQQLAHQLGAHIYIDGSQIDPAEALRRLGGAALILATAPNAAAIGALVEGIRMNGKMIVVAAPHEKVAVNTLHLLGNRASIMGWPGGTPADSEDTIAFAMMTNVRPLVEVFPLTQASIAYERLQNNLVRFRAVLDCRTYPEPVVDSSSQLPIDSPIELPMDSSTQLSTDVSTHSLVELSTDAPVVKAAELDEGQSEVESINETTVEPVVAAQESAAEDLVEESAGGISEGIGGGLSGGVSEDSAEE